MSKAPLVFLTGFLCDERIWTAHAARLSDHPSQILDLRHLDGLEPMLDAIAALQWPQFHLIGFSMGGFIAQAFAVRFPNRILSLILVGASGSVLPEKEISARTKMESLLRVTHYKGMSSKEIPRFVHPDSLARPEIGELILEMSRTNDSTMYINQMHASVQRKDVRPELALLSFPITLIAGHKDPVIRAANVEAFADQIPRTQLHWISPCGHYIPFEQPEQLAQLLTAALKG